ncbi:MAG: hypothetical protein R2932_50390 [Caldilineaceae bacterium]
MSAVMRSPWEAAQIGHNLNFGGFSLTTAAGSQVGRSLYGGGYQLLLNGSVANDVHVGSAALELNGHVGGSVYGTVESANGETPTVYMPAFEGAVPAVAPGLRVSNAAEIGGALSVSVQMAAPAAVTEPPIYSLANAQLRWAIGEVIALLIVGLIFLYIRPTLLGNAGAAVQSHPFQSLGIGVLILLVAIAAVPIIIALLVLLAIWGGWFTLGQLVGDIVGLGFVTLLFAIGLFIFTAGMLTKIIVAYGGGHWVVQRFAAGDENRGVMAFGALALGVIIYMVLRLIPFGVGVVIGLLVTLVGLGALYLALRGNRVMPMAVRSAPQPTMREVSATGD